MISAPLETVFRLAARVEDWPYLLAHYRAVEVRAERPEGRLVSMAAFRRGVPVPVRWKALQTLELDTGKVLYRHVGGVTRGMRGRDGTWPVRFHWSSRPRHRFGDAAAEGRCVHPRRHHPGL